MKTATITKSIHGYDFDLQADDKYIGMASHYHPTKEDCIQIIKDHFPEFEIVDKTEEK